MVAFDVASSGAISLSLTLSVTVSHTCTGSDGVLIVDVIAGSSVDISTMTVSCTYAGTPMTSLTRVAANNGPNGFIEKFYLLNPASGINDIVATRTDVPATAQTTLIVGGKSYNGASQTTADYTGTVVSAFGSGTTPTVDRTGTTNTSLVDDGACAGVAFTATGANQTQRWQQNVDGGSSAGNAKGSTEPGNGGTVTMSHTITATDGWAVIAVEIRDAFIPPPVLEEGPATAEGRSNMRLG